MLIAQHNLYKPAQPLVRIRPKNEMKRHLKTVLNILSNPMFREGEIDGVGSGWANTGHTYECPSYCESILTYKV
jgi:hypothetical protein